MSFHFNWKSFDNEDYSKAKLLIEDALNKPSKPPIIVDKINVQSLNLGDLPPVLEILEIGDLADDRFRGIFKLKYAGNGSMTLRTKIQANPLCIMSENCPAFTKPKFKAAASPLHMPLTLTLSDIKLSGIIILVFSKAKGLTIVFRNDPLESIRVSSSFNEVPGIDRFLQTQIENQIRILCREELPSILHKLSLRWTRQSGGDVVISAVTPSNGKVTSDAAALSLTKFKAPVSFADINPGSPELSPASLLRLNTLFASQSTLSLFTPAVPHAAYRSNMEKILDHEKSADEAYHAQVGGDDVSEIARLQSRFVLRKGGVKPKRRVIKIGKARNTEPDAPPLANDVAAKPTAAPAAVSPVVASVPATEAKPVAKPVVKEQPSALPVSNQSSDLSPAVSVKPRSAHLSEKPARQATSAHQRQVSLPNLSSDSRSTAKALSDAIGSTLVSVPEKLVRVVSPKKNSQPSLDKKFKDFFTANVQDTAPPPYVA